MALRLKAITLLGIRVIGAATLASTLALALPACGGEEGEEATGTPIMTIEIVETDFALDPATVELDKAGTYTFRAVNRGNTEHALEIESEDVEEETETIEPGESAELTVKLEAGEYELYCPVGDHKERGMDGAVSVVESGSE